ncbi:hypothetical protein B0O99DRAFT_641749 [Bisporella sp. PMI_857]|nr:hypothetical protein B0O99DRAFT_641749 [Bisporella sp. PMI_857]
MVGYVLFLPAPYPKLIYKNCFLLITSITINTLPHNHNTYTHTQAKQTNHNHSQWQTPSRTQPTTYACSLSPPCHDEILVANSSQVSETVQGAVDTASKETNKNVAKDSNADASTRLTAGKDAIGDKLSESSHDTKADVHKGMFTSSSSW